MWQLQVLILGNTWYFQAFSLPTHVGLYPTSWEIQCAFFLLVITKVNVHLPVWWYIRSSLPFSFSCQFRRNDLHANIYAHSWYHILLCARCFSILSFLNKILNFYLLQFLILWITFSGLHVKILPTTNHKEDTCLNFTYLILMIFWNLLSARAI